MRDKRNKYLLAGMMLSCLSLLGQAQNRIGVQDLNLSTMEQEWWTPQKNKAVDGTPIQINGQKFKLGIGTHSTSTIHIFLQGEGTRFTAQVGIADHPANIEEKELSFTALGDGNKLYYKKEKNTSHFKGVAESPDQLKKGSVRFLIYGDGKLLWKSKKTQGGKTPQKIDIDLTDVQLLKLEVTDGGDGPSGDHAVWAEPVITYKNQEPRTVDEQFMLRQDKADTYFLEQLQPKVKQLKELRGVYANGIEEDWLVKKTDVASKLFRSKDNKEIIISNGLISRSFRLTPNTATVSLKNLVTGEDLLRAIKPEALLEIDGTTYQVGGLDGQFEYAYLKREWLDLFGAPANAFELKNFKTSPLDHPIQWKKVRWAGAKEKSKGMELAFEYAHPSKKLKGLTLTIHYAIYDGISLISKWFTLENNTSSTVRLNHFVSENLAVVEGESIVTAPNSGKTTDEVNPGPSTFWQIPNLYVESDYAFNDMTAKISNKTAYWVSDPDYTSQVNWLRQTPCMLEVRPPIGPNIQLEKGKNFESFRTYVLSPDSQDKERRTMAQRRMYRTIAPWSTENPIFMHLTTTDPVKVKEAIDQCAETGYEMVILSFGSGLNMEDNSEKNHKKFKELADYAHSKGIEIGGYSLLSSRRVSEEADVINHLTGKRGGVVHGNAPCLGSTWGQEYIKKLETFFEKTGFNLLEHDGSYPGHICASTSHPGHEGTEDSQWKQWKAISNFYKGLREKGVYMNIPDWYFLAGSNKVGIGYREVNWSLPRERQLVIGRQNIYDGTWEKIPSMGWTFVPLVQYHGGGAAATLEPLNEHLDTYEAHMAQNYGLGIQACYRGPRLYDTKATKAVVIRMVKWYKKYREILNSDIIHLRRANGSDLDYLMHVNPELKEKGFVMIFNPTGKAIRKSIDLPLYYTGLTTTAHIREKEEPAKEYSLNRMFKVNVEVEVPANGYTWLVIE